MAKTQSLAKVSGSPVEFDLKGEPLLLYPMRFLDWGRVEQWMRGRVIAAGKEATADCKGTIEAVETIRTSYWVANRISIMQCFSNGLSNDPENQAVAFLSTAEGMLRTIHISLRDKVVSLEQLQEKIGGDIGLLAEMFAIIMKLSFVDENDENDENDDDETTEKNAVAATAKKKNVTK